MTTSKLFLAPILGVVAAMTAGTVIVSSETSAQTKAPQTSEPVLLELFTSQGCSSCPPADRVAAKLDRQSGAVVLSRPVTYWDRLGWKDTLASEANTDLQRAYSAKRLRGRNGVYTPQIVTDGRFGAVGSQENHVRTQMELARHGQTAAVRAKRIKGGGAVVGIAGKAQRSANLELVAVQSKAKVAIGRGENSGRSITYTNVVKSDRVIADWSGGNKSVTLSAADFAVKGADRYALVLREKGTAGKVLAASWVRPN